VVLAILAGRAALVAPRGFADARVVEALRALYAPHAIVLDEREHRAFVANAIALAPGTVWMAAAAEAALSPGTRSRLEAAGFHVASVPLSAIEAAGGSLRCCVAEIA
jgi:N-dimethylarginine dimethylaminohydrolase